MAPPEINNYISKRYDRWLDYSKYHCSCAGMPDEAVDVLNEVLLSLLQKDSDSLMALLHKKKDRYCELDFYVLRMIKLNATSDTSPYRYKRKKGALMDENVDFTKLELEEDLYVEDDEPSNILEKKRLVYDIVDNRLDLTDQQRQIFYHRLEGEKMSDWKGPESAGRIYDIFNDVKGKVIAEIERDKIKKTAEALLKTVDAEVKIIKSNIKFKNEQIIEKQKLNNQFKMNMEKDDRMLISKSELRELLLEIFSETKKKESVKKPQKLLNVDVLKEMIFDAIKTELISA